MFSVARSPTCRILVAASLMIGASARSPDAQQRDADGELWKLQPPSAFRELPVAVRKSLEQQKCKIPQWIPRARGVRSPHNVVTGEFEKPGQRDWAALCVRGSTSAILVFWEGSAAPIEEVVLGEFTLGQSLGLAKPDYIRAHQVSTGDDYYDQPPTVVDHHGLEDAFQCCSTICYYHQGRWLRLPGAD